VEQDLKAIHAHASDVWYARAAVAAIAGLQLLLRNDLTLGPRWFAPVVELTLLVPLAAATAWTQASAAQATTRHHWLRVLRARRTIRAAALALTALITLINGAALADLVHDLVRGTSHQLGRTLLLDALIV
jgi:hypothetical protein